MSKAIHFKLNGQARKLTVDHKRTLLWVLRTDFGLIGTKYGCGEGLCGACTVLVNGKAVRSCQLSVEDIDGSEVITIEGLARNDELHPLQEAFVKHDALQCGYCTPGMILSAHHLLSENPDPTYTEILAGMEDNLCRCGSHARIVKAIQTAAKQMREGADR